MSNLRIKGFQIISLNLTRALLFPYYLIGVWWNFEGEFLSNLNCIEFLAFLFSDCLFSSTIFNRRHVFDFIYSILFCMSRQSLIRFCISNQAQKGSTHSLTRKSVLRQNSKLIIFSPFSSLQLWQMHAVLELAFYSLFTPLTLSDFFFYSTTIF